MKTDIDNLLKRVIVEQEGNIFDEKDTVFITCNRMSPVNPDVDQPMPVKTVSLTRFPHTVQVELQPTAIKHWAHVRLLWAGPQERLHKV
jgi:hypothetical protein